MKESRNLKIKFKELEQKVVDIDVLKLQLVSVTSNFKNLEHELNVIKEQGFTHQPSNQTTEENSKNQVIEQKHDTLNDESSSVIHINILFSYVLVIHSVYLYLLVIQYNSL